MLEILLRAYHTEGLNIADAETLERLGAEAGLAVTETRALLAVTPTPWQSVPTSGVPPRTASFGVPSLVIAGGSPVPAIQPPADLAALLATGLEALARKTAGER